MPHTCDTCIDTSVTRFINWILDHLGVAHIRVIPFSNTILTAAVIVVIIIIANITIPIDLIIIFIFGIHIFMKTDISASFLIRKVT